MVTNTQANSLSLDNALNNATKIGTLNGTRRFVDSVDRGLQDYYSFHLNSASPFNLSLQGSKGDADVQLLDRSGKVITSSTGTGTDEVIKLPYLSTGDYYIRVSKEDTPTKLYKSGAITLRQKARLGWANQSAQQPVPYTLQIANANTAWIDDSFGGANDLGTLNSRLSAQNSVSSNDAQDYYRFHVDFNHPFFNLSLKGLSGDADVQLLGRSGELLASSKHLGSNDESINLSDLFAGDYFIRVYKGDTPTKIYQNGEISLLQRSRLLFKQNGQQLIPYTLQISNASPSDLLPVETDLGALNDTRVLSGNLTDKNAVDDYQFKLGSNSNFNAVLTGLNRDANFRLILDNNNNGIVDPGEEISRSTQVNAHDGSINVSHLVAGSYFLQVYRNDVEDAHYTLKMSNSSPNNLLSKEFVIGNLKGTRLFNGSVNSSNTSDTYAFHVDATNHFDATLTGLSSDADLYLIEDVNHNGIVDGDEGRTASLFQGNVAEMVSGALPAGDYFIQVNQYNGDTSYNLTLSTGDWFSQNLRNRQLVGQARMFMADGSIDRKEMINLLQETENRGAIDATEISDLQKIISTLAMPDYVKVLASKVVNGNPANDRSGIRNLTENSSSEQMERLIYKWFFGTEHPQAFSFHQTTLYQYQKAQGKLFQDSLNKDGKRVSISYEDVHQLDIGDCYFVASLAELALRSPGTIQNMFIENDDNGDGIPDTWTVRFYHDGAPDFITVDRYFPVDTAGHAAFAGWDHNGWNNFNNSNNELWVALAEKAYAQANESGWIEQDGTNSYNGFPLLSTYTETNETGINGGYGYNALAQITGRITGRTAIDHRFLGVGKEDTGRIADAALRGDIVTLGTSSSGLPSDGVPGGHEYALIGYDSATGRYELYNPWGRLITVDRGELLNNFSTWSHVV